MVSIKRNSDLVSIMRNIDMVLMNRKIVMVPMTIITHMMETLSLLDYIWESRKFPVNLSQFMFSKHWQFDMVSINRNIGMVLINRNFDMVSINRNIGMISKNRNIDPISINRDIDMVLINRSEMLLVIPTYIPVAVMLLIHYLILFRKSFKCIVSFYEFWSFWQEKKAAFFFCTIFDQIFVSLPKCFQLV
jgi:hypothetical protein